MQGMSKRNEPKKPAAGREAVKYVALPVDLHEELKAFADADERSVNWAARKLIREALDRRKEAK
jgi:hypothetical protein